MTLVELLELARRERLEVQLIVDDCWYGCCNRPPSHRGGYEQTYRGVIDLHENRVILHAIAIGSLNYHVVVTVDHINDATLVD